MKVFLFLTISIALIAIGLVIDMLTFVKELQYEKRGQGSSGIPVIGGVLYLFGAILLLRYWGWTISLIVLLLLVLVHLLLQFSVPLWSRFYGREKG